MEKMKILSLTLPSRDPFDANPPEDEHGAVMVDMEEADLVELLPQDEKHRVQELHSFGDVVPPESRCYLKTKNGEMLDLTRQPQCVCYSIFNQ